MPRQDGRKIRDSGRAAAPSLVARRILGLVVLGGGATGAAGLGLHLASENGHPDGLREGFEEPRRAQEGPVTPRERQIPRPLRDHLLALLQRDLVQRCLQDWRCGASSALTASATVVACAVTACTTERADFSRSVTSCEGMGLHLTYRTYRSPRPRSRCWKDRSRRTCHSAGGSRCRSRGSDCPPRS